LRVEGCPSAYMISAHRGENLGIEQLPSPNPRAASFLLPQSPTRLLLLSSSPITALRRLSPGWIDRQERRRTPLRGGWMREPPPAGRTPRFEAAAACSARRAMGRLDAAAATEGSAERRGRLDAAAVEAGSVPERGEVVGGWCPVYTSVMVPRIQPTPFFFSFLRSLGCSTCHC
jgi:hypothetical protein